MHQRETVPRTQVFAQDMAREARTPYRWMAWLLVTLLMAGLAVGVSATSVTVSDPDWGGTVPENISHSPQDWAFHPVIAASTGDQLTVAWSDRQLGESKSNIYTVRSYDNGHTWSAPSAISPTIYASQLPDALIAGDQVFVAWAEKDGNQYYTPYEAELEDGEVRSVPLPDSDAPSAPDMRPSLAVGSDRLHLVFNAGKIKSHILHSSRPLAATMWPTATRVYTSTANGGSWYPVLAYDDSGAGDKLHLVWEETHSGSVRMVMYISGTVSGGSVAWASSPITLSTEITLSVKPDIAVESNGNLHVVWGEVDGGESYVRYTRYDAGSGSWTLPAERIDPQAVSVNELSPTDTAPRISLFEGDGKVTVCAAWHGFREGGVAEEVWLNCSEDGGESWPVTYNMSRSPADVQEEVDISIWPAIAFDSSGVLHGVWEQRVRLVVNTSYYEIYHAFTANQVFLPLVVRNY